MFPLLSNEAFAKQGEKAVWLQIASCRAHTLLQVHDIVVALLLKMINRSFFKIYMRFTSMFTKSWSTMLSWWHHGWTQIWACILGGACTNHQHPCGSTWREVWKTPIKVQWGVCPASSVRGALIKLSNRLQTANALVLRFWHITNKQLNKWRFLMAYMNMFPYLSRYPPWL